MGELTFGRREDGIVRQLAPGGVDKGWYAKLGTCGRLGRGWKTDWARSEVDLEAKEEEEL